MCLNCFSVIHTFYPANITPQSRKVSETLPAAVSARKHQTFKWENSFAPVSLSIHTSSGESANAQCTCDCAIHLKCKPSTTVACFARRFAMRMDAYARPCTRRAVCVAVNAPQTRSECAQVLIFRRAEYREKLEHAEQKCCICMQEWFIVSRMNLLVNINQREVGGINKL